MEKVSNETLEYYIKDEFDLLDTIKAVKNDSKFLEKMAIQNGDKKVYDLRTILSFTSNNVFSDYCDILDLYTYLVNDLPKDRLDKVERPLYLAIDYVFNLYPEIKKMTEQVNELYEVEFEYEYLTEAEKRYGKYYPFVKINEEYLDNYLGKSKTK